MPRAELIGVVKAIAVAILLSGCASAPRDEATTPSPSSKHDVLSTPPPSNTPDGFDVPPQLIRYTAPIYPDAARRAGLQGTVFCDLLVNEMGEVIDARVAGGVAPLLDEAAVAAARTAIFSPAMRKGTPVAAWVRLPMTFRLR